MADCADTRSRGRLSRSAVVQPPETGSVVDHTGSQKTQTVPESLTGSPQTPPQDAVYRPGQMSWWSPSWFPNIPSFDLSIPAGLQRHFLSYLLNKFLGHFVKNGQLDARSIDSQIGSGYVQVKDIELDPTVHISPLQPRGFPFIHFRPGSQHVTRWSSGTVA